MKPQRFVSGAVVLLAQLEIVAALPIGERALELRRELVEAARDLLLEAPLPLRDARGDGAHLGQKARQVLHLVAPASHLIGDVLELELRGGLAGLAARVERNRHLQEEEGLEARRADLGERLIDVLRLLDGAVKGLGQALQRGL